MWMTVPKIVNKDREGEGVKREREKRKAKRVRTEGERDGKFDERRKKKTLFLPSLPRGQTCQMDHKIFHQIPQLAILHLINLENN